MMGPVGFKGVVLGEDQQPKYLVAGDTNEA